MIKKETIIMDDGMVLYKTYSDIEHKIRKIGTLEIYSEALDVIEDVQYEEISEYVEIEGVKSYEEVLNIIEDMKKISLKINRLNLSNNEALTVKDVYPKWNSYIGRTIELGFIILHEGLLWKSRQTHTVLENYPPSINTASLYEIINEEHSGNADDPIPYIPPMEIFNEKYYIQDGVVYLCVRDSGMALSHNLSDLVGIYVTV